MEKKHFSLTIFFSETIAPRRTGVGLLERARHALYAHIFFVQIGLIGSDTDENLTGVIRKGSPRPEPSYNGLKVTKEKKHFSLTIFFSETIAPRRTGLGSLERARRALYAHIFFVQIGPIGAKTQENRSGVIGKDSSRPLRPYFFLPDWTNRSRVITKNLNGVIGKDSSRPLRPYFFLPDRTNRSRVITHPGEPVWGHWKGLVGPCTHIFFSSRSDQQEPSYNGLKGTKEKNIDPGEPVWGHWKGLAAPSPRRTGPGSLERARRVLYARIFFVQIGPIGAKVQRRKTLYLTIFFSETVAPRRTCPGSLERARRALYAHIFFVQIGPIGADTYENLTGVIGKDSSRPLRTYFFFPDWTNRSRVITKNLNGVIGKDPSRPLRPYFFLPDRTNRSRVITHPGEPVWGHWKGLVGPCTHIFFSSRSDQQEPSYNGLKGTKEKNIWHLGEPDRGHGKGLVAPSTHIFFSTQENRSGVIGKGSPRPVRTYFFRPDRTNRGRVITHLEEPERGHWKGLVAPCTHIFFCPDRTNRSRVITRLGEPNRGHWKGPDASSTPIGPIGAKVQRRKTLYLTIFFSETVAPRRTCPGSLERARRALYAHIFFVQIGPIGAETEENRSGVIGTGSPRPVRTYFFRPDRTNRGRVITEPSYNGLKVTKEKKHFSLTIFFSETIAPRRTGLGSLERARRALYAHIFFVQIGPIGAKL
ncbi:hypothetical protein V1477_017831 [Vespula maculifrons]|uniref:Ribosomal protein S3 n=1 Tax=Vespula maculifrons TaxID=7453 RepID=A0ABD2AZG7_VESMC